MMHILKLDFSNQIEIMWLPRLKLIQFNHNDQKEKVRNKQLKSPGSKYVKSMSYMKKVASKPSVRKPQGPNHISQYGWKII